MPWRLANAPWLLKIKTAVIMHNHVTCLPFFSQSSILAKIGKCCTCSSSQSMLVTAANNLSNSRTTGSPTPSFRGLVAKSASPPLSGISIKVHPLAGPNARHCPSLEPVLERVLHHSLDVPKPMTRCRQTGSTIRCSIPEVVDHSLIFTPLILYPFPRLQRSCKEWLWCGCLKSLAQQWLFGKDT